MSSETFRPFSVQGKQSRSEHVDTDAGWTDGRADGSAVISLAI